MRLISLRHGAMMLIRQRLLLKLLVTYPYVATQRNIDIYTPVPTGVTYTNNFTATQGTYVVGTGVWTVGALVNGASATLTIDVTVD